MNFWMLIFIGAFVGAIFGFLFLMRRWEGRYLRDIPAFYRLKGSIEVAVEDGSRVHISIGRSDITSPQGAAALVGLSMLKSISKVASDSDKPPIATAGDGVLAILAQDTLRSTYQKLGLMASFNNNLGRVTGLTPFSYAAGSMPVVIDEDVSSNLLAGSFGDEVALITSAGERRQVLTVAGTENLLGQAILFAAAHEPLVGEELYAGGAYLDAGPAHVASLHAQDVFRWLIAVLILGGALLGLLEGLF